MKLFSKNAVFYLILAILPTLSLAQTGLNTNGSNLNAPRTAVPFLNITPDSRSGALGDAGVALSSDLNDTYWNPAKLAFLENTDGVSVSYSPWLRQLIPDLSLSYLTYAHVVDNRNAIGVSLRYFNYGTIQLYDPNQNSQGTYYPNEYSINVAWGRKFGDGFSLGLSGGYVHSNLSDSRFSSATGDASQAGNALFVGFSLFYKTKISEFGKEGGFSFGTNVSNIGTKVSYSDNGVKDFLPSNLKVGIANTLNLDQYNQLTFTVDLNKLMVPFTRRDAKGNPISNDNISVVEGIFQSFSDAPQGISQQLEQITYSPGVEYLYNHIFAIRAGYFYQNPNSGGANYFTMGLGFRYQLLNLDFSYISAPQQNSPFANTIRFTLSANLGSAVKK